MKIKLSKKTRILAIISILLISILLIFMSFKIVTNVKENEEKKEAEEIKEISYIIYKVDGEEAEAVITIQNESGINSISYVDGEHKNKISGNGKEKVAFDYKMDDMNSYVFEVCYNNGEEKTLQIDFEIPRIQGLYTLKNGIYANEPDISTGFAKDKTRYIYLNESGYMNVGNWISDSAPENWYDYKNQNWANIYVENEGLESYYVWIPRYCYKVDTEKSIPGNERMDIKFINVYNQYIDGETGEKITWTELESQGYQIPEAFWWSTDNYGLDTMIPGYWMSKYQLSSIEKYVIDYFVNVNKNSIVVGNISKNTSKSIAQYTYAVDGKIYYSSDKPEDYVFENVEKGNKIINVTALDSNGEIVGSMTKTSEVAEPNPPELSNFNPDTTFYVYWDENGNEHNEVPISMEAPDGWYDYTSANWANIVTRNDGMESYYVWIPRYEYQLNSLSQRSYIKFLKGTTTEVDENYQIPEAFWWDNNGNGVEDDGEQITGYWMSKYQLTSEEGTPRMNVEMSAASNLIRLKNITGTLIATAEEKGINVKYEYYLNGALKHEGISSTENYIYTELESNKLYTINVIARNNDTDEYIGAVTKQIKTTEAYAPDMSSFNSENTYYVVYDKDYNETRIPITESVPEEWFDYSNQKWANIVTTANGTETYFVWIPRYEYKILPDRTGVSTANRRIDVSFITTDITNANCTIGYEVPEAFWWDNNGNGQEDEGEQITGYWMSKYQLSN